MPLHRGHRPGRRPGRRRACTRGRDHDDIERDHAPGGIPTVLGNLEASARGREATRRAGQHGLGPKREASFVRSCRRRRRAGAGASDEEREDYCSNERPKSPHRSPFSDEIDDLRDTEPGAKGPCFRGSPGPHADGNTHRVLSGTRWMSTRHTGVLLRSPSASRGVRDRALHASPLRQSEKSCLRDRGSGGRPQLPGADLATRLAIATIVRIGGLPSALGRSDASAT